MSECDLIKLCVKQGTILGYPENLSEASHEFKDFESAIKAGRYGLFNGKGTSANHLYVVLTQDCTISSGQPVELAQIKKENIKNADKVEHIFLGQDYNKLYLRFEDDFYQASESLLTKVENGKLVNALRNNTLEIKGNLLDNDTRILLDWRILAYHREPYPDKLNKELKIYLLNDGRWFIDFLKKHHDDIHSIRVFVTPDIEDAEEYKFSITALLTKSGKAAETEISNQIDLMIDQFSKNESIDCIQSENFDVESMEFPEDLVLSLTVSLDEFTFANAYVMREFNFQYLCY